jgi:polyisoprenyl-phosphate glycosyltransferase
MLCGVARMFHSPQRVLTGDLVVVPVYNDWASAELLLERLAQVLAHAGRTADVLMVDDGSTEAPPRGYLASVGSALSQIQVLKLSGNLGHQRALAIGLAYIQANCPVAHVVVMDGDGEDAPEDVPRLLTAAEEHRDTKVIFAERTKRSEGLVFRAGYAIYRWVHRFLTGVPVKVGNFSVIPAAALDRLVVASDLWNHYAATVVKTRVPYATIPTHRATRLAGQSRMNLVGLVVHGLSAIAVFGDRVGVRLLFANLGLMILSAVGMMGVLGVRAATDWAIPGWATMAFGLLAIALLLGVLMSVVFVLVILAGRGGAAFLPVRDHSYYIASVVRLPRHETSVTETPLPVGRFHHAGV